MGEVQQEAVPSLTPKSHKEIYQHLNVHGLEKVSDLQQVLNRKLIAQDVMLLGLAPSTRCAYQAALTDYINTITQANNNNLHQAEQLWNPDLVLHYLTIVINRPGWKKANSILTRLRQITAAAALHGHPIADSPQMMYLTKGLKKLGSFQNLKQATPMTFGVLVNLVFKALRANNIELAALLSLMWLLALRMEDALRVPRSQVSLKSDCIVVQLKWHKTQAHSTHKTSISKTLPLAKVILLHLNHCSHNPCVLLFRLTAATVDAWIKKHAGATFSKHSIRRGALQHLEQSNAQDATLLQVSGHRSTQTLQRYLSGPLPSRRRALAEGQILLSTA